MDRPSLAAVVDLLQEIAPLELAAAWDNVGLLIEPRSRRGPISRVLLTVDLTPAVTAEARRRRADLVVAYHPPIFQPLPRLTRGHESQRRALDALAAGFATYSPHTALDAAPGGLADWLAEVVLGGAMARDLAVCGDGEFGRLVELPRAVAFAAMLRRIKRRLGVRLLQVARPPRRNGAVRRIAVAAGAGAAVLRGVAADLWLTGELPHHDVLAALANGTSVVLAGHSNTERGYLGVLRRRLLAEFPRLEIALARADRDPLVTV